MKVQIFDENQYKFFDFLKMTFYSLERLLFSLKRYLEVFPGVFSIKTNMHEISNLCQNHGLTPLENCKFFDFLKMTFL